MRRFAAVALMAGLVALPLCAQRPTGRNSSAGHSSPASHSGIHASAPRGSTPPAHRGFAGPALNRQAISARSAASRPVYNSRGSLSGGAGSGDPEHRHHRRPYVSPYGSRGVYGGPGYGEFGWINPYPLGYPETDSTDDSAAAPDQASAGGYDSEPDEQFQPPPRELYQPPTGLWNASPAPENEQAVTLIFKDGRPAEQIHNYILTRATLFVGDGQRREISTDQLDLAATAKANQDQGVDFRLPDAHQ